MDIPWHATTFGFALLATAAFGLLGILLILLGYKIFDWLTPINVAHEIAENKNIAMAIVVGAVIIGIAMVTAAAISG